MAKNYSRRPSTSVQRLTAIVLLTIAVIATALSAPIAPIFIGGMGAVALWQPQMPTAVTEVRAPSPRVNRRQTVRGVLLVKELSTGRIATRWVPA